MKSSEARVVVEKPFHGEPLSIESGWVAKQAAGAVLIKQGETMVLATVCRADARPEQSFFPLTCDYIEKGYAAGKIPGGFFKREGRPGEEEILTARLTDRPIRPLFPDGYMDEVQIITTVLSADGVHNPQMLAVCGASAALHISEIPFMGPIALVRVGRVDKELIINPNPEQVEQSDIDLIVAGTSSAIVMVEGGAKVVPEKEILDALYFGHSELQHIIEMQEELRSKVGKDKMEFIPPEMDETIVSRVTDLVSGKLEPALSIKEKQERSTALSTIKEETQEALAEEFPEQEGDISEVIYKLTKNIVRTSVVDTKQRIDGRDLTTVRPIESEIGIIPRAHGSALFTRGETQAFVTTTLGTGMDAQRIDSITEQGEKNFMLHYNFPPYCTGECKFLRGTARREIGHGNLAWRAIEPVLPSEDFPYVVRIVSDIMESNGSSSMATVCGGSLSLMDAGVNVTAPVAGVAMGLIKEGEKVAILTDILGDEDHLGDMDFKVAGSREGITALQMDIKCEGLARETMEQALEQAHAARIHILDEMGKTIDSARDEMSRYAPRIETLKINPDKIRDVIGPGGKMIRSITESTGVKIDISDDGTVQIFSSDMESTKRAIEIIEGLTEEPEVGKKYCGVVKRITDFGAFVEILPGIDGLVHISQFSDERIDDVSDFVTEGDELMVQVLDIDRQGRVRLSHKEAVRQ